MSVINALQGGPEQMHSNAKTSSASDGNIPRVRSKYLFCRLQSGQQSRHNISDKALRCFISTNYLLHKASLHYNKSVSLSIFAECSKFSTKLKRLISILKFIGQLLRLLSCSPCNLK